MQDFVHQPYAILTQSLGRSFNLPFFFVGLSLEDSLKGSIRGLGFRD